MIVVRTLFRLRAWILSLLFLFSLGWLVESSKPFQSCIKNEQHEAAANNLEKSIATIFDNFSIYRDCTGHFVHTNAEAIIAGFTVLLVLATIFLWVATRDLVSGADRTAERQLRAYILGNGGSMRIFHTTDGKAGFEVLFQLKNFGQTPAQEFRSWIKIDVFDKDHGPFGEKSFGLGTDIVGPTDIRDLTVKYGPTDDATIAAVIDGTKKVFIWGGSEYRDVFGHPRFFNFHSQNGPYVAGLGGWPIQASNKPYEAN